jgi:hypothetical protein
MQTIQPNLISDLHQPVYCAVEHCGQEAMRWIPLDTGTLRLCVDHLWELAGRDEDPEYICGHEVGVYMCAEECIFCN